MATHIQGKAMLGKIVVLLLVAASGLSFSWAALNREVLASATTTPSEADSIQFSHVYRNWRVALPSNRVPRRHVLPAAVSF